MNRFKQYLKSIYRYYRYKKSIFNTLIFSIKLLFNFYVPNTSLTKAEQIEKLLKKISFDIDKEGFIYSIDVCKTVVTNKNTQIIDNIAIDYDNILSNSLDELRNKINLFKNSKYKQEQLKLIDSIYLYLNNLKVAVKNSKKKNYKEDIKYIENIKNQKCNSFEEALQRILIFNQLFWQTNHNLMGLGRLDFILDKYYTNDIKNKIISKEKAEKLIKDFYLKLSKYYWYKSNGLLGDTGQLVILGGLVKKEKYFYNDLTYMFIKALKEIKLPDPKCILRVSNKTPNDLLELALKTISTGIGSPLLCNDDVIIQKLIDFGYAEKDSYNYATAACWEPYIPGMSLDQNNIATIVYIKPLLEMLNNSDLTKLASFQDLLNEYYNYLDNYLKVFIKKINLIRFEEDPLLSLLSKSCLINKKDISQGGGIYNNYGLTSVSLSNTVNALYNINELVFKEQKYSLDILVKEANNNFSNEQIFQELKQGKIKYGIDNKEIINLTNEITKKVENIIINYNNYLGGRYKFGLSSPAYISSCDVGASLDGRRKGQPFGVHISNEKSSNAYTELINFASQLDYNGIKFNCNVVDFIVSPSFISNSFDKFLDFIKKGISIGFFEMQINVVDSKTLIDAKKHPEKFPNLIVRVWGFSAYFNDLPIEYKDLLIKRALESENNDN